MDNNGDKLIERIIKDAEAEAAAMIASGSAEAERILVKGKEEIESMRKESELACERVSRQIAERSRIRGELEARKFLLSEKRKIVREVFDAAFKMLSELSGAERESLLKRLLEKEAEGGESIYPSPADRNTLQKLLPELNEKLKSEGLRPLVLEARDGNCSGGFVLVSETYEKDCSFEEVMKELMVKEEANVAQLLF